jgi:VWFA-related protein
LARSIALSAAVFALITLALGPGASVRAADPVSGKIIEVDDSGFPSVRLVVSLAEANGRPVTGLGPSAFSARETGAAASVDSVQTVVDQGIGIAVVLTIDTSGSMQGNAIAQAKSAAAAFIDNLQPVDQAALISFSDDVVGQSGFGADRGATKAAVSGLQARGNTALYSAVARSIEAARGAPLSRRAIVLLSDGEDFGGISTVSRDDSLKLAGDAGVPIYAIGEGPQIDRQYLQALAQASGGAFLEAPTAADIPRVYEQLSQLFRSQYVITLTSSGPEREKQRSVVLDVKTAAGNLELKADYQTRRNIPETAPEPAVAPPPPQTSGSGVNLALVFAALLGAGAVLGSGGLVYSRVHARRVAGEIESLSARAGQLGVAPAAKPEARAEPRYRLVVADGPGAGQGFVVRDEPLTIGSSPASQVKLEAAPGIDDQQARVWVREGKLMFHQLSARTQSLSGGRPLSWSSLDPGDEVVIGPVRLRVEVEDGPAR